MNKPRSGALVLVGIGLFVAAFLVTGVLPRMMRRDRPAQSVEEIAAKGIIHEFVGLAERFPERFERHFPGGVTVENYAEALRLGYRVYVAEACWHCHTQQVRPLVSDERRWGPATAASEYEQAIQPSAVLGMRRVGPDLARQSARRSNDWHLAHFYDPISVVAASAMPAYRWFFDSDGYPNKKGMAIITYLQWLGSGTPASRKTRTGR